MRNAKPKDADELARTHVLAWQQAYKNVVPDTYLRNLDPIHRATLWQEVLNADAAEVLLDTVDGDSIAGFAAFGRARDEDCDASCAELAAIYYLEEHWGSGRAQALWNQVASRLKNQQYSRVVLWVLAENDRAIRFYDRNGFVPDGKERTEELGGKELVEIRMATRIT